MEVEVVMGLRLEVEVEAGPEVEVGVWKGMEMAHVPRYLRAPAFRSQRSNLGSIGLTSLVFEP